MRTETFLAILEKHYAPYNHYKDLTEYNRRKTQESLDRKAKKDKVKGKDKDKAGKGKAGKRRAKKLKRHVKHQKRE